MIVVDNNGMTIFAIHVRVIAEEKTDTLSSYSFYQPLKLLFCSNE